MKSKCCLLLAVFLLIGHTAKASLKIDASVFAGRVGEVSTKIGEIGTVVTETTAMIEEVKSKGEQVKVLYEKTKMQVENALDKVKSFQPAYDENGENAANSETDTVAETGDNSVVSEDETYEEELVKAEEKIENMPSAIKRRGLEAAHLMGERKNAMLTSFTGDAKAIEENIDVLNSMLEQTKDKETRVTIQSKKAELENQLGEVEKQIADVENEGEVLQQDPEYKNHVKTADELSEQLKTVLDGASTLLSRLPLDKINGMLKRSKEKNLAKYNAVIEENFLLPEEEENGKNVGRIQVKRYKELVAAIAEAFLTGVECRNTLDEKEKETNRIYENMLAADMQVSSIGMMTEQKIHEIKLLHEYNKLKLANMKLKTAMSMIRQDYHLVNYDKDPTVLNLDNYIMTDEDVTTDEGKKSFLESGKLK